MKEKTRAQLVVGAFLLAAIGVFVVMVFKLGGLSLRPTIRGSATFDDVTGLVPGSRVTVAGVAVGSVRELSVAGSRARVELALYEGSGLSQGALCEVRARSLLGEKYLAIVPAEAPGAPLQDGFELHTRPSAGSIDDMMARLARSLDKLPLEALAEDLTQVDAFLKEALPRLDRALDSAGEIADTTRELHDTLRTERPAIHRAVAALAEVAEAYRPNAKETSRDLAEAAENLRKASAAFADLDREELRQDVRLARQTLDKLPATLDRLDRVLSMLERLDGVVDRLSKIDDATLHRYLREEGVRIRFSAPDKDGKE